MNNVKLRKGVHRFVMTRYPAITCQLGVSLGLQVGDVVQATSREYAIAGAYKFGDKGTVIKVRPYYSVRYVPAKVGGVQLSIETGKGNCLLDNHVFQSSTCGVEHCKAKSSHDQDTKSGHRVWGSVVDQYSESKDRFAVLHRPRLCISWEQTQKKSWVSAENWPETIALVNDISTSQLGPGTVNYQIGSYMGRVYIGRFSWVPPSLWSELCTGQVLQRSRTMLEAEKLSWHKPKGTLVLVHPLQYSAVMGILGGTECLSACIVFGEAISNLLAEAFVTCGYSYLQERLPISRNCGGDAECNGVWDSTANNTSEKDVHFSCTFIGCAQCCAS